jgi:HD superfamily phosphohydrolase
MAGDSEDRYKDDKWTEYTQFKDTVHGDIKIHKPLAKKIINTREFQRLKNVEQTGMGVLYPSATHNRFIHSLGVYHLGTIAFQNFKENIKAKYSKDCYYLGRFSSDTDASLHWCVWEILFKLACLLHDIGHTPFSHSLEILYDVDYVENVPPKPRCAENSRMNVLLYQEIINPQSKDDFKDHIKSGKVQHERMSAHLILKNVTDNPEDKPETNFKGKIKDLVCSYVHAKCSDPQIGEYIPGYDFEDDLEFMARMIVGCPYQWESKATEYLKTRTTIGEDRQDPRSWTRELQLRNCIIKFLNSAIDVDNLDYATRDMQCSGYANALVDIERLLNSFTVIEGVKCEEADIDFTEERIHNPVECTYFKGDTFPIHSFGKHNVRIDKSIDEDKTDVSSKEDIEKITEYRITKRHEHEDETGSWIVEHSWDPMMTKRGQKRPEDVAYMYLDGEIRGVFTGKIYGETYLSRDESRDPAKITPFFEFAFDKTSQSVFDGAVFARNYEYLWIYAHHTITYHTNYLTMHMLKQYCEILHEKNKRNIPDELSRILENPPECSFVSSGETAEKDEIDVDSLFCKLFDAILSSSALRIFITKDEQRKEDFRIMTADFVRSHENKNSGTGIPDKENSKPIWEKIKVFLENIPKLKGQREYVLFKSLIELYLYNNSPNASEIDEGNQRKKYLKESIDWIIILFNEYYTSFLMRDTRGKLIVIFNKLIQLVKDVINNENADDFKKFGRLLFDARIRDQKLRLANGSLKYMCDVIAMLDKKIINNFVFFRSSDDDLNTYYRSLENELFQKKKENLTLNENEEEFLVVADEYFSRNFAAAMWKTYTEYAYLFHNWKKQEKNCLIEIFENFFIPTGGGYKKDEGHFDYNYFVLSENTVRLTDNQQAIYNLLEKEYGITRFVFVRQSVKAKLLDLHTTFFAFKENVLRFRDIELFNKQKIDQPFFYFYYKKNDDSLLETKQVIKLLGQLQDMMKKKVNERRKAAESGCGLNEQNGNVCI